MICSTCKEELSENCFSWKNKEKKTKNSICKKCHSEYRKKHYRRNETKYKEKAKKNNTLYKKRNQQFLVSYLKEHPCVDCGESNILVLEFDHQENKEECISKIVGSSHSLNRLKEEIEKCKVRCANCHRIKTAKEQGYYKLGE